MANHRLRDALLNAGVAPDELASDLGVDPKTVERWITTDRVPYPKHRHKIALQVGESERYLWPHALADGKAAQVSESEVIKVYAHRNDVPPDLWDRLVGRATAYVDILVYVGMFLTEKANLVRTLQEKASNGARVRLLFGDRNSRAVKQRSREEGIGDDTISAKIDHALSHFSPLIGQRGIELRTHGTILYNSIYRFDDEMIVNPHVYGTVAPHAPALHLRRLSAGALFTTYADSFTTVWEGAKKYDGKGGRGHAEA
ncbi:MAG: XRE family transcriptional regulator [Propionibacteriales bacterium]|nr:XRE family transcriptional regulator [Propionibacteriales bacterium]